MKKIFTALIVLFAIQNPVTATTCIDPNNDGWGWDGQRSCRTAASICVDPNNDGWGWDGQKSCRTAASVCVDPNNDGWGWDGQKSCRTESTTHTSSCHDPDNDGWGWDGQKSCSTNNQSGQTASVHYKGVTDTMWNEIDSIRWRFNDNNNCRARVQSIPNGGYELSPCNGSCINDALRQYGLVKLRPGRYQISETINVQGKKLIGAHPTNVVIDASNVDTAVSVQNSGTVSNLSIQNARNVGVSLGDYSTLHKLSITRTGYSSHYNDNGAGVFSYNRRGNCIVSVAVSDGYNEDGKSCGDCYNGGNADGFKISHNSGNNTLIDTHSSRNSDDGFDFWESQQSNFIYFSSAFDNGKPSDGRPAGDGNGFKFGTGSVRHYAYKSSAFNNRRVGFHFNFNKVSPLAVGCNAYNNAQNWSGVLREN